MKPGFPQQDIGRRAAESGRHRGESRLDRRASRGIVGIGVLYVGFLGLAWSLASPHGQRDPVGLITMAIILVVVITTSLWLRLRIQIARSQGIALVFSALFVIIYGFAAAASLLVSLASRTLGGLVLAFIVYSWLCCVWSAGVVFTLLLARQRRMTVD